MWIVYNSASGLKKSILSRDDRIFYFGGEVMPDLIGLVLIIIGAAINFGSKYLVRLIKLEDSDISTIIIKSTGFLIVIIGCLKVFEII